MGKREHIYEIIAENGDVFAYLFVQLRIAKVKQTTTNGIRQHLSVKIVGGVCRE